jgi:hypothetical protein
MKNRTIYVIRYNNELQFAMGENKTEALKRFQTLDKSIRFNDLKVTNREFTYEDTIALLKGRVLPNVLSL